MNNIRSSSATSSARRFAPYKVEVNIRRSISSTNSNSNDGTKEIDTREHTVKWIGDEAGYSGLAPPPYVRMFSKEIDTMVSEKYDKNPDGKVVSRWSARIMTETEKDFRALHEKEWLDAKEIEVENGHCDNESGGKAVGSEADGDGNNDDVEADGDKEEGTSCSKKPTMHVCDDRKTTQQVAGKKPLNDRTNITSSAQNATPSSIKASPAKSDGTRSNPIVIESDDDEIVKEYKNERARDAKRKKKRDLPIKEKSISLANTVPCKKTIKVTNTATKTDNEPSEIKCVKLPLNTASSSSSSAAVSSVNASSSSSQIFSTDNFSATSNTDTSIKNNLNAKTDTSTGAKSGTVVHSMATMTNYMHMNHIYYQNMMLAAQWNGQMAMYNQNQFNGVNFMAPGFQQWSQQHLRQPFNANFANVNQQRVQVTSPAKKTEHNKKAEQFFFVDHQKDSRKGVKPKEKKNTAKQYATATHVPENMRTCSKCNKVFSTVRGMLDHKKIHDPEFIGQQEEKRLEKLAQQEAEQQRRIALQKERAELYRIEKERIRKEEPEREAKKQKLLAELRAREQKLLEEEEAREQERESRLQEFVDGQANAVDIKTRMREFRANFPESTVDQLDDPKSAVFIYITTISDAQRAIAAITHELKNQQKDYMWYETHTDYERIDGKVVWKEVNPHFQEKKPRVAVSLEQVSSREGESDAIYHYTCKPHLYESEDDVSEVEKKTAAIKKSGGAKKTSVKKAKDTVKQTKSLKKKETSAMKKQPKKKAAASSSKPYSIDGKIVTLSMCTGARTAPIYMFNVMILGTLNL